MAPLDRVREPCLSLPEVTERLSHGSPTWFIRGKKTFVTYLDNHHGDGRLALWCAAPPGMQEALVAGEPEHYFVPPYVGHRGWIGVHLNRGLEWPPPPLGERFGGPWTPEPCSEPSAPRARGGQRVAAEQASARGRDMSEEREDVVEHEDRARRDRTESEAERAAAEREAETGHREGESVLPEDADEERRGVVPPPESGG